MGLKSSRDKTVVKRQSKGIGHGSIGHRSATDIDRAGKRWTLFCT
jgi:hypothetical protein